MLWSTERIGEFLLAGKFYACEMYDWILKFIEALEIVHVEFA